jgi:hypothetical protein
MREELYGDRRISPRLPCSLKGIFFSKDTFCQKIECHDITAYGARISTSQPLSVASYVDVAIDTAKMNNLSAQGKVCWCAKAAQGWQAGIAFDKKLPFSSDMLA